jgi:hypothetical protein
LLCLLLLLLLQAARPSAIMDLIHSAESWTISQGAQDQMPTPQRWAQQEATACVLPA